MLGNLVFPAAFQDSSTLGWQKARGAPPPPEARGDWLPEHGVRGGIKVSCADCPFAPTSAIPTPLAVDVGLRGVHMPGLVKHERKVYSLTTCCRPNSLREVGGIADVLHSAKPYYL